MWVKPLKTSQAWENGATLPTSLVQDQPIEISDELAEILIRDELAEACDAPEAEAEADSGEPAPASAKPPKKK
jgi:hypothetical protein